MRVKSGTKKIMFTVILGLPLMMPLMMVPAYSDNAADGSFCEDLSWMSEAINTSHQLTDNPFTESKDLNDNGFICLNVIVTSLTGHPFVTDDVIP